MYVGRGVRVGWLGCGVEVGGSAGQTSYHSPLRVGVDNGETIIGVAMGDSIAGGAATATTTLTISAIIANPISPYLSSRILITSP